MSAQGALRGIGGATVALFAALAFTPLSNGLKQSNRSGHRHVKTLNVPRHRNRCQPVAPFPDQPPQTCTLGSHHQRGRQGEVDIVVRLSTIAGQPDSPHPVTLQDVDRPRDVDDVRHPDMRHRAG